MSDQLLLGDFETLPRQKAGWFPSRETRDQVTALDSAIEEFNHSVGALTAGQSRWKDSPGNLQYIREYEGALQNARGAFNSVHNACRPFNGSVPTQPAKFKRLMEQNGISFDAGTLAVGRFLKRLNAAPRKVPQSDGGYESPLALLAGASRVHSTFVTEADRLEERRPRRSGTPPPPPYQHPPGYGPAVPPRNPNSPRPAGPPANGASSQETTQKLSRSPWRRH
jgi:hypothetical protein